MKEKYRLEVWKLWYVVFIAPVLKTFSLNVPFQKQGTQTALVKK